MIAFITATVILGSDLGMLKLYSDVDGFTTSFGPMISPAVLQNGYIAHDVPNGTTIIRVVSQGPCENFTDIPLDLPEPLPCSGNVSVFTINPNIIGGLTDVVKDSIITLYPGGGVVSIVAKPNGQAKFEIIHNGVKKATSAQTGLNAGPFDNVYGMSPGYTIPTAVQAAAIDQFIATSKGPIPNRNAAYLAETGIAYISAPADSQMVWWKYSAADVINGQQAILRITTDEASGFFAVNACQTTSTTTTTYPGMHFFKLSGAQNSETLACADLSTPFSVTSSSPYPVSGNTIYATNGVTPFVGNDKWYKITPDGETAIKINNSGLIISTYLCS